MPDVKVWRNHNLPVHHKEAALDEIQVVTAREMSCLVDRPGGFEPEPYEINPSREIDISVFGVIEGRSAKKVLVEVAAYPFKDRMSNITERIANIALNIARLFDVDPDEVGITFIEVNIGNWTTGASR